MSASVQQQVLDGLQRLSSEEQQLVLDLVISLQNKHAQSSELLETPQSFLDVAGEYIGRGEGASDLSTNPEYMEEYGENASTGHS
ncbi:hypothetical protein H6F51_08755 [Cyanobacteria bacterium FACHB-DQ100]|uniref:hypothetical protein n=1 Tax=Leptolyngbya sp. DQ-M1 TaxID=2933920 RepID=UPI0019C0A0D1|nr:hypothetical protein [Cyanobacteria bacterium FACHB-DQ100]